MEFTYTYLAPKIDSIMKVDTYMDKIILA